MAKRIIALLLALTLVFAFAACKKSDKDDKTTDAAETEIVTNENGETEIVEVEDDETEAETETNADGEVVTDAEAAETATNASGDKVTTTVKTESGKPVANKVPSTKAEIVAAFNKAANAVKADKPGYHKDEFNDIGKIQTSSKLLNKMIPGIVGMFDPKGPSADVAKGASHNAFPVEGGSTNLSAAAVKSAKATKAGNGYKIRIDMADEKLATLPANPKATQHGKAFNVLSKAVVDEQVAGIPGVNITKFQPTYSGSYIECTINADGKMTKATYNFSTHAILHVKAVGIDLDVYVPFAVRQVYTIKY